MGSRHIDGGAGFPWDTEVDAGGNIWFTVAGCDFFDCGPQSPAGQIGVLPADGGPPRLFQLPATSGNNPAFLTIDPGGHIWFTTPVNSMIGEFDPGAFALVGQWPVAPGSGPWDLVYSRGALWYTAHHASAIGRFDPGTHRYTTYPTPSPGSHPYGIAARGSKIWFTEDDSDVARIGVLDTADGNRIAEYQLRAQLTFDITPHKLAIDDSGVVWFSGGWVRVIGSLDPGQARPGDCGSTGGNCAGVREYALPPAPGTCAGSHVSGIAADARTGLIWFTDSLSAQVGSFDPRTGAFNMHNLRHCDTHPHDGLSLHPSGAVWWNEEFDNSLGYLR
jgi:streptogramin lyase